MNAVIICHSEHHGNTRKLADVISEELNAKLVTSEQSSGLGIGEYDLVGFGSGIYYGDFHKLMYKFLSHLPRQQGKKAFLFSTTGSKTYSEKAHTKFTASLREKGFDIVGEYSCFGFDTALSAEGINRGHPTEEELKQARAFAGTLKKQHM
jgi:flavodoxin